MKDLLHELNHEQREAVAYLGGSALVVAGAGSGKTKVLTTRIAWLLETCGVIPDEILAVTFTNKAAKEMLSRLQSLAKITPKKLWIGTFHSIALKILSKYHQAANLNSYFQVLDVQDQINVIKRVLYKINLDEKCYSPKDVQKFINSQKECGLRSHELEVANYKHEQYINIYRAYEEVCNKDSLVDFTELLLRSYELLSNNKSILSHYHDKFKHILVDEFQDTNHLQYKWVKLFKSDSTHIFAVGDDDQSIYSFRGAQVTNMQLFIKDFKITDPIRLQQNYRSTTNILQAANSVINNNNSRIGKQLWTDNGNGAKIKLYEGYTEEDEAFFVMDEIRGLMESEILLKDIAILFRSNAQSRVLEHSLYSYGIPYRVYGGLRFFDRQEIKIVLAYLRLAVNNNDNDSFIRVINYPPRGIGAKTIELIQKIAVDRDISLLSACSYVEGKSKTNVGKFMHIIGSITEKLNNGSLKDIITYIIEQADLIAHYSNDRKQSKERIDNLNELINSVDNFNSDASANVTDFLTSVMVESTDNQLIKEDNAVQLMTVHAAKGLEFRVVFVVGLEDGLFPYENSLTQEDSLEEERRLMYVAITRAREQLYLLRACSRLIWGVRQVAPLSRFVNEIPSNLISNISGVSCIGCDTLTAKEMLHSSDTVQQNRGNVLDHKTSYVELPDKNVTFKIGDIIRHEKFGNGKILNLSSSVVKMTADIFFVGIGKKTLDLNIAKIAKV